MCCGCSGPSATRLCCKHWVQAGRAQAKPQPSSASGQPQKRYDDAITYLNNINAGLGGTVRNNTSRFRDGHRISLGQTGRAITDLGKRDALRALLLCLVAFGLRNQLANAKTEYGAASRADIDDAIQSWWPIDGRGAADIATAAATAPDLGALNLALGRRGTFKTAITCYWTVAYWAFKAGVVSMRFLRDWDEGLNPFKAKDTLLPNPTQYASRITSRPGTQLAFSSTTTASTLPSPPVAACAPAPTPRLCTPQPRHPQHRPDLPGLRPA